MNRFLFQHSGYAQRLFVFWVWLAFPLSSYAQVNLQCPDDLTVNLPPWECSLPLDYASLEWSSNVPLADTVFSPSSGHLFEAGETVVTLTGVDFSGNSDTCQFTVSVEDVGVNILQCNDNVHVFLEADCEREISPQMMLEGGPYGCEDRYTAHVISPSGQNIGNVVNLTHAQMTYAVRVTDVETGQFCWGYIAVSPDHLPPSIACPSDTIIFCNQPVEPEFTGLPAGANCISYDDLEISHNDLRINTYTDGDDVAFTIDRTWTAIDPYDNETVCVQYITARRVGLADIVFPPDFDGSEAPALSCSDTLSTSALADTSRTGIPLAGGYDPSLLACDLYVDFTDEITNTCGEGYTILREWTVIDFTTETQFRDTQMIVIQDVAPPVFQIPDTVWVSANAFCGTTAALPAATVLSECSDMSYEIRSPWDTIATNGGGMAISQTPGIYELTYQLTDACGNAASQTAVLLVDNGALVTCPANAAITSNYYGDHLKDSLEAGNPIVLHEFGVPVYYANCPLPVEESFILNLNACGEGQIERTMIAIAGTDTLICEQTIRVNHVSDFVVRFPADQNIEQCTSSQVFNEPVITGADWEQLDIFHNDLIFDDVSDACYKIIRTWFVINPCVTGDSLDNEVVEASERQLQIANPGVECDLDGNGVCDTRTFRDSWTTTRRPGASSAAQPLDPDTDPDSDPWDGFITYEQVIKVLDEEDPVFPNGCQLPDVCITGDSCDATVTLPQVEYEDCSPVEVRPSIRIGNTWMEGYGPYPVLPPGNYPVEYRLVDICNNWSLCTTTLKVKDCQAPVAACRQGLAVNLFNVLPPQITVWANDFNDGSYDNCPGSLKYSFSNTISDIGRTFDCFDVGGHDIQMWVTDQAGNQSFCESHLVILPGNSECKHDEIIEGKLSNLNGLAISGATVNLQNSGGTFNIYDNTYQEGKYAFIFFPFGEDLSITPTKNINPLNGVTTFDIVLASKHVLGTNPLDSPYKIIAADANKSNSVTTADLVAIRKLVLLLTDTFPNGNHSWRFIDEQYDFPNPQNPFAEAFPERINLYNVNGDYFDQNFIGIKIGDLNLNADPGDLQNGIIEERNTANAIPLFAPNPELQAGETVTIPFTLDADLSGFQGGLSWDVNQLELLEFLPGVCGEESVNLQRAGEGLLPVSWYSAASRRFQPGEKAFALVFKTKASGSLHDWLSLAPSPIVPEAYTGDLQKASLHLQSAENESVVVKSPRFFAAQPNPFRATTQLEFYLPEAAQVRLTVNDPAGKLIRLMEQFFGSGYQTIELNRKEFPANGVYFYRIETGSGSAAGRFAVMD
jgi:hypothetical protein